MKTISRREIIIELLEKNKAPLSASAIAKELGVSRQIIVGDIALLRASGGDIIATPRGYVLNTINNKDLEVKIACRHNGADTEKELLIMVDNGCIVKDVIVEHPVYGQLTGELNLASRYDVKEFIEKMNNNNAHALSELNDGLHLHTLIYPDEQTLNRVKETLERANILYQ